MRAPHAVELGIAIAAAFAAFDCGGLVAGTASGGTDAAADGSVVDGRPETSPPCRKSSPPQSRDACSACPGTCADGRCLVTLAHDWSNSIAVNASSLFYLSPTSDLVRVPLGGGAAVTLATELFEVSRIAADEASVYWLSNGCTELGDGLGKVMKIPVVGGTPRMLASTDCPGGIAIDASAVFWATGASMFATPASEQSIVKVSLDGGATSTLVSGHRFGGGPVLGGGSIYWSTGYQGSAESIVTIPLGGGAATTLADATGLADYAADDASVYWIRGGHGPSSRDGAVLKVARTGGPVVTLATQQDWPVRMAVDSHFVYWTNGGGLHGHGQVMRVDACGGVPTTLSTASFPGAIVASGSSVFWSEYGPPAIRQLTPR